MPKEPESLIRDLRRTFRALADPERAAGARRYMKSAMPYYGIPAKPFRKACKEVFARHPLSGFEAWREAVLVMFRGARHREERYAAIELSGLRAYAEHRTMRALPVFEEIIVTGAWWDLVDGVAAHRLGGLLRRHPASMKKAMLRWSREDDMWKRRGSILCQLRFKEETDLELLYACIEPSLESREFFLRKAIGWALRQYAWTEPREIVRYVKENESRLSPLSRREALRNIGR